MNPDSPQPLAARRIVITRAAEQAGEFADLLRAFGAEVIEFPTIAFRPPESFEALDAALGRLPAYDWVIFTSVNGVRGFFDRLSFHGRDGGELSGLKVCAIGPATAEALRSRGGGGGGIVADLVPETFQAEGILEAWAGRDLDGMRILLARAAVAREVLPEALRKSGARVDVVAVYRTVPAEGPPGVRREIMAGDIDVVTFTSPSTVENFCALFREEERARFRDLFVTAVIGPITRDRIEKSGLTPGIEADPYTVPALAEAIVRHFGTGSGPRTPLC
ncbi:MAG: uroporphyrinogen-III synthase [Nitrospinota bacterium]|nr:uroporphyrinogen-III synthase [Nitrospinota bacterium]HJM43259.1 uroporphyrinogen-III synthase [Nitrospinota bacterium]